MTEQRWSGGRTGAIVLIVLSSAVLAVLAVRHFQLQAELRVEYANLTQSRNRAATSAFDRLALPPNRKLTVCNHSGIDATISALTAVYIDPEGRPATFNSASDHWRTWKVPAGSTESLIVAAPAGLDWDGSAIFYAMEVGFDRESRFLTGTADDLKSGCIRLALRK